MVPINLLSLSLKALSVSELSPPPRALFSQRMAFNLDRVLP